MSIGYDDPPFFPFPTRTNEEPPRDIMLLGEAAYDPDCWVATIRGETRVAWVIKGTGGVCHDTTDVLKVRALHWDAPC